MALSEIHFYFVLYCGFIGALVSAEVAAEGSAAFLHIILTLGILLFASKLFAELFHRIKMRVWYHQVGF
jgi:hypothetical protein